MNKIKATTKIILILLLASTLASLFLAGFMPIFSIAFGFLFLYYLLVYFLISFLKRTRVGNILIYLLFVFPILWAILDWENLLDFLLQAVHLDMK